MISKYIDMTGPKVVKRGWGKELWIANSTLYRIMKIIGIVGTVGTHCGKLLYLKEGHCCSYHYHLAKDETFLILEGEVDMDIDGETVHMLLGDGVHIAQCVPHRFYGATDATIIEVSTLHSEDDSYRIIPSGECDNPALVTRDDVVSYAQTGRKPFTWYGT